MNVSAQSFQLVSTFHRIGHILHYGGYVLAHQFCESDWQATARVFDLLDELEYVPKTFIDVGANNSQWGGQFARQYAGIEILSFEPNPDCHPIGRCFPIALSDRSGHSSFVKRGGMEIAEAAGGFGFFELARFDSLPGLSFAQPAALKIDCESYTSRALKGFGNRIREFAVVIVEMWNHSPDKPSFGNQQADIWRFMLDNDFRGARAVATEFSTTGVPFYDMAFYRLSEPVLASPRYVLPSTNGGVEEAEVESGGRGEMLLQST